MCYVVALSPCVPVRTSPELRAPVVGFRAAGQVVAAIGVAYRYYFVKVEAASKACGKSLTELPNGPTTKYPLARRGHNLLVQKYYLDHLYTDSTEVAAEMALPLFAAADRFGWSVAIDGDTVVIGASHFLNDGSGSAYVFDPNRPTSQPTTGAPTPRPTTSRPTPQPTTIQPTTAQPTPEPKPRQQQQLDLVATILICVAAAVVFACGCLAYARYVRYGSREGPKSDLEPLAEPEGTTPAPTKEATVLSIPPESELEAEAEAEEPPPPPTNPLLTGDLSATELAGDQTVIAVVAPIVGALLCLNLLFVIGVLLLHKRKRAVGFA